MHEHTVGLGTLSNANLTPAPDAFPLLPLAITGSQAMFSETYAMILTEGPDTDWTIPPQVAGLVTPGKADSTDDCSTDFPFRQCAWRHS